MNRRDSVNHWSVLLAFLTDISSDTAWQISSNDISCETTCQISFNLYVSTLCGPLASLFKSCWFPNSSWFRESLKVLIRIFFKQHLLWNLLLDYFQIVFVNTFGGPLASLFKSCWFSDSGGICESLKGFTMIFLQTTSPLKPFVGLLSNLLGSCLGGALPIVFENHWQYCIINSLNDFAHTQRSYLAQGLCYYFKIWFEYILE